MKREVVKNSTSQIFHIFIQDSSQTDGSGLTGLVFNTAGLTAYYIREGDALPAVEITLVTATIGTYASGGFKEVDSTNMPGIYELHIPDAAFALGSEAVVIMLKGASNMAPLPLEIQLIDAPATTAAIATAVLASTIDGTLDMTETLKVLLALGVAKKIEVFGSVYTFQDQSGNTKVTITYDAASGTAVIT